MNLCQLKHLSCFGCCGHTWGSKKQVLAQIDKNTKIFKYLSREEFGKRGAKYLSASGVCKSLICKKGKVICGLHPEANKGRDFRDNICDKDYMCKTFKAFLNWDKETQKKFIKFILNKNLDNWQYSIGMDSDKLLKEFNRVSRQP